MTLFRRFAEPFVLDLRSLALFRVSLAMMVLCDLALRAQDFRAFFTDEGILPRSDAVSHAGPWAFSFHLASGEPVFQALLFILHGVCALALLVGYRTRLATLLTFLLTVSLQNRNIPILQGSDWLLSLLLFWSLFLPVAGRFSVDAALNTKEPPGNRYLSVANVALLVQIVSVYYFSALLKSAPEWIPDGTAVFYALHGTFSTHLGQWVGQFKELTRAVAYYVWYLELIGPFLLFLPICFVPVRLVMQAQFILMHVGFLLLLQVGQFPFISITSLFVLTPPALWDWLGRKCRTRERLGLEIYYDGGCEFCKKICLILREFLLFRDVPIRPAQDYPEVYLIMQRHDSWVVRDAAGQHYVRWEAMLTLFRHSVLFRPFLLLLGLAPLKALGERFYGWVARNRGRLGKLTSVWLPYRAQHFRPSWAGGVLMSVLLGILCWANAASVLGRQAVQFPAALDRAMDGLMLYQRWNMFAPAPGHNPYWYVAYGVTRDGTVVDAARGKLWDPKHPFEDNIADRYENYRWRKYLTNLWYNNNARHRRHYADFLCRRWNGAHVGDNELRSLTLAYLYLPLDYHKPPAAKPTGSALLKNYRCQEAK